MKLLIDSADIVKIKKIYRLYPIDGVTTNPTILSKEGGDVLSLLREIRKIIGYNKELHVQVTETDYESIIEEADAIVSFLGKNTFVKIPATAVGLKATKTLSERGFGITATSILTATQALLASNAGAAYVAPYVSRLENINADGIGTVADIARIFKTAGSTTQILAASFKTAKEVLDVATVGCHAATVGTDIMHRLVSHPTIDTSLAAFRDDWKRAFGDTTLLKLLKK